MKQEGCATTARKNKDVLLCYSLLSLIVILSTSTNVDGFVARNHHHLAVSSTLRLARTETTNSFNRRRQRQYCERSNLHATSRYDDDDDDDDDDDYIDMNSLGDWRNFRRSLTLADGAEDEDDDDDDDDFSSSPSMTKTSTTNNNEANELSKKKKLSTTTKTSSKSVKSVSKDNEELLKSQNKDLAKEYVTGVWAHEIPTVCLIELF
jgi:hypothetical protein